MEQSKPVWLPFFVWQKSNGEMYSNLKHFREIIFLLWNQKWRNGLKELALLWDYFSIRKKPWFRSKHYKNAKNPSFHTYQRKVPDHNFADFLGSLAKMSNPQGIFQIFWLLCFFVVLKEFSAQFHHWLNIHFITSSAVQYSIAAAPAGPQYSIERELSGKLALVGRSLIQQTRTKIYKIHLLKSIAMFNKDVLGYQISLFPGMLQTRLRWTPISWKPARIVVAFDIANDRVKVKGQSRL